MRILVAAICAAFLLSTISVDASDKTGDGIRSVISQQIRAFQQDDAKLAFSFAAPSIQQRFGSSEIFMAMVARGYPQLYRAQSFSFSDRVEKGGVTFQKVVVVGRDGVQVAAFYQLVKVDGAWRISGCQIARLPGQDV